MPPRQQDESPYDFDAIVDRIGTSSTKHDKYLGQDILPLWVADMDFASPPPVIEAMHQRLDHGVFGYTEAPDELIEIIRARLVHLYDWLIEAEDLVFLPGVVPGLNVFCRAFSREGVSVMTAVPIYQPFMDAPAFSGRGVIKVPSVYENGTWSLPFDALAKAASRASAFLLCNPYNPVGRVLARDEVEAIVDLCVEHDLVLCSDEIHCDLLFDDRRHVPAASISADAANRTITLMAPSKTFNLAGFGGSFAVIQNADLRERFKNETRGIIANVNIMAYVSMLSAYRDCTDWHAALIAYLEGNRDYLYEELNALPGIRMNRVEGTYLAWLDISALKVNNAPELFERAGLGMSEGARFGDQRFMRLNFGCSRRVLEEAVERFRRLPGAE